MSETNDHTTEGQPMDNDGEAGVPENEAFDGDATTSAMPSGIAPGGNDAMPDDGGQPPIDGGVMGAVPENGSVAGTSVEPDQDRAGELSPEEQGR